jgi:hypothetical protein
LLPYRRILAGILVLMAVAAVTIRPGGLLRGDAGSGSGASPLPSDVGALASPNLAASPPTADPAANSDELAFAEAYLGLATTHDAQATDLLIANPLAEFDLVGERLIDLLDQTRQQVAELPSIPLTAGRMRDLEHELGETVELLRAVDPHGPPVDMATEYQHALDYWIEHVHPVSEAIRASLGLPPPATGDLRL